MIYRKKDRKDSAAEVLDALEKAMARVRAGEEPIATQYCQMQQAAADYDFELLSPADKYRTLWNEYLGDREGADTLLEVLTRHGFFEAPASKGHHLNQPGGLCLHSYHVADRAIELCMTGTAFKDCDVNAVVVAALLHDICKIDRYVKTPSGYRYRDTRMLGHGEESVMMAAECLRLTVTERLAIRWHMGAYADPDKLGVMSQAYDACPEAMCVHFADMIATHIDEK